MNEQDPQVGTFYAVRLRPDTHSLVAAGIKRIQPGMAAEVFVLTEARSAFDYLVEPVTDALRHALREK